jgi:hypothetical protein
MFPEAHAASIIRAMDLFHSGFPTKTLYAFLISHARNMPAHLILLALIQLKIYSEEYKPWNY